MTKTSGRWVKLTYANADDPLAKRLLIEAVERATGRGLIERLYNRIRGLETPASELWGLALQQLEIDLRYDPDQLGKAAAVKGPVVFIANHPYGVVDGLVLGHLVSRIRQEYVILVNEVLTRDERLAPYLLPVDFRETREALRTNIESRQEAIRRLQAGGALAIFPSGGVATSKGWWGPAVDLEWKRFVVKLIRQSGATVVPLFFPGQNSRLFQVVSQFSLPLRLGLLLHETRNKIGRQIRVVIGDPVSQHEIAPFKGTQEVLDHLRNLTLNLEKSSTL